MSMPHGHSPATAAFGSPRRRYHALGSAPVQILRPSGFSQPQHLVRAGEAVLPADASTSPFSELQLAPISEGIATKRLRQHVNPLASRHTAPPPTPDWPAIYAQPTMPLVLDLGCGSGRFLLLLAQRAAGKAPTGSHPSSNYLGIEIRQALVERANSWAARLGASRHVAFMYANASLWLGQLLHSYPGPLDLVCIQYPDPHFKRKHHKRRIFQPKVRLRARQFHSCTLAASAVLLWPAA